MIDHNAQRGHPVREAKHRIDQSRVRIRCVQFQPGIREHFHIGEKCWTSEFVAEIPTPDVAEADSQE